MTFTLIKKSRIDTGYFEVKGIQFLISLTNLEFKQKKQTINEINNTPLKTTQIKKLTTKREKI